MQDRFGFADNGRSIQDETQADCFAGAWTALGRRRDGRARAMRTPELDDVIRGFLLLRDHVGSDPDDSQAHGSYFDRVWPPSPRASTRAWRPAATTSGPTGCSPRRRSPPRTTRRRTAATRPSRRHPRLGRRRRCRSSGTTVFPAAFGKDFTRARRSSSFDGTAPELRRAAGRAIWATAPTTAPSTSTRPTWSKPAYDEIGDFAVATAISLPYSLAARSQAGLSTDDGAATRRRSA